MNHLEQLVAEWYEYNGYFVRRNVAVGKRPKGGYECELDIVAFHPVKKHLIQVEPSLDAHSWQLREERYQKKFSAGRKFIPLLFDGLTLPEQLDQLALFTYSGKVKMPERLAGGRVMHTSQLFLEIMKGLEGKSLNSKMVPEQFPLLRTIQHCAIFANIKNSNAPLQTLIV